MRFVEIASQPNVADPERTATELTALELARVLYESEGWTIFGLLHREGVLYGRILDGVSVGVLDGVEPNLPYIDAFLDATGLEGMQIRPGISRSRTPLVRLARTWERNRESGDLTLSHPDWELSKGSAMRRLTAGFSRSLNVQYRHRSAEGRDGLAGFSLEAIEVEAIGTDIYRDVLCFGTLQGVQDDTGESLNVEKKS